METVIIKVADGNRDVYEGHVNDLPFKAEKGKTAVVPVAAVEVLRGAGAVAEVIGGKIPAEVTDKGKKAKGGTAPAE